MGNKLKNIRQANLLLERRYLSEQNPTGITQPMSGTSRPTSGSTQTPPPSKSDTSVMSQKQTAEFNKIKQLPANEVQKKYLKCKGDVGEPIEDEKIKNWGFKIHKFGDTFCTG